MARISDILLTALAPAVWGSTYIVTTEALPAGHPLTLAALRALPAGILLLALTRSVPPLALIGRILVLGVLNFGLFWTMLFIAAERLPGGVAATLGAVQALMVIALARAWLGTPILGGAVIAAVAGVVGVALLLLGPAAALDPLGILAGALGAASMAAGTVLSRKWAPPVSALRFTAWQLTAGGLVLLPLAMLVEPALPSLSAANWMALAWLGLIRAAASYGLWFRGLARLEPTAVSMLGMVSPIVAVALGWLWLHQSLTPLQILGGGIVLASVWAGQIANRLPQSRAKNAGTDRRRKRTVAVDLCALSEHRLNDLGLSRSEMVGPAPSNRYQAGCN
ncbi:EamA family transporter [Devosia salina]|uniref:EamA family transporter n=1 Tax=Devosia salina TaxID=2860336 RepID=A0ABX8WJ24_9HYPH|nr:EamA family transporter [Devosia salina]QYO76280.1 EamA family transporter [Devosia salina]